MSVRTLVPGQMSFEDRQVFQPEWLTNLRQKRLDQLVNARKPKEPKAKAPKSTTPKPRKSKKPLVIPPDVQAKLATLSPEMRKALGF